MAALGTLMARPHFDDGSRDSICRSLGRWVLLVAGTLVTIGQTLPVVWMRLLEGLVAVMLVILGLRAVFDTFAVETAAVPTEKPMRMAQLPFSIGMMHGLAESGALATLSVSRASSTLNSVAFILAYGAGAALGMVALAALLSQPFSAFVLRSIKSASGLSGAISLMVGIFLGFSLFA
jgi:hypothetical protein